MQTQAKWITELTQTLLKHWKAMKTVQLTSISVSTKSEKQAGTIQFSKYIVYTRCAQSLHKCYSNVEMIKTKCPKSQIFQRLQMNRLTFLPSIISSNKIWFRQSIYTILTIEICYNRQIHEK